MEGPLSGSNGNLGSYIGYKAPGRNSGISCILKLIREENKKMYVVINYTQQEYDEF